MKTWLQKYHNEITDGELSNLQDDVIVGGTCPGTYFPEGPILGHCPKIYLPKKEKMSGMLGNGS